MERRQLFMTYSQVHRRGKSCRRMQTREKHRSTCGLQIYYHYFQMRGSTVSPVPWRSRAAHLGLACRCPLQLQISNTGLQCQKTQNLICEQPINSNKTTMTNYFWSCGGTLNNVFFTFDSNFSFLMCYLWCQD